MSARPLRVVGLDLSLTSSGISDGQSAHVIQTGPDELLEARLDRLVRGVVSFVLSPTQWTDTQPQGTLADLVVIEGASYGSKGSGVEQLSALRLMVRHRLWRMAVPFALVAPPTLKLYTTGNGKATKPQMVAAVDERHMTGFASVKVKDGRDDLADAFALAAMGYDHVGQPLPAHFPAPPPHRPSLLTPKWPDLVSDD